MAARRFFTGVLITLLVQVAAFAAAPNADLVRAAERGDQAAVRSLLRQGADVNAPGVDGSTPLHRASSRIISRSRA
jgi:ankyrin repeat protein